MNEFSPLYLVSQNGKWVQVDKDVYDAVKAAGKKHWVINSQDEYDAFIAESRSPDMDKKTPEETAAKMNKEIETARMKQIKEDYPVLSSLFPYTAKSMAKTGEEDSDLAAIADALSLPGRTVSSGIDIGINDSPFLESIGRTHDESTATYLDSEGNPRQRNIGGMFVHGALGDPMLLPSIPIGGGLNKALMGTSLAKRSLGVGAGASGSAATARPFLTDEEHNTRDVALETAVGSVLGGIIDGPFIPLAYYKAKNISNDIPILGTVKKHISANKEKNILQNESLKTTEQKINELADAEKLYEQNTGRKIEDPEAGLSDYEIQLKRLIDELGNPKGYFDRKLLAEKVKGIDDFNSVIIGLSDRSGVNANVLKASTDSQWLTRMENAWNEGGEAMSARLLDYLDNEIYKSFADDAKTIAFKEAGDDLIDQSVIKNLASFAKGFDDIVKKDTGGFLASRYNKALGILNEFSDAFINKPKTTEPAPVILDAQGNPIAITPKESYKDLTLSNLNEIRKDLREELDAARSSLDPNDKIAKKGYDYIEDFYKKINEAIYEKLGPEAQAANQRQAKILAEKNKIYEMLPNNELSAQARLATMIENYSNPGTNGGKDIKMAPFKELDKLLGTEFSKDIQALSWAKSVMKGKPQGMKFSVHDRSQWNTGKALQPDKLTEAQAVALARAAKMSKLKNFKDVLKEAKQLKTFEQILKDPQQSWRGLKNPLQTIKQPIERVATSGAAAEHNERPLLTGSIGQIVKYLLGGNNPLKDDDREE